MKWKIILMLGILLAVSLVRADLASDLEALGGDMPIKILNVQSYPIVGNSWITNFQTLGKANLKITPFNGTLFGEDIEFVSLKCGDNIVEPTELTGLYVKFDNYYCFSESHFEVKVLSSGKHTLRFEFGDEVGYSYNEASLVEWKDNCQTRCVDGKCNTVLGRTIWVNDSDGTCKPIEQAKSLKNGFYIKYLEIDPSFNLIVNNFNYTEISMDAVFNGNPLDYPEFCDYKSEIEFKCQFKSTIKWDDEFGVEQTVKYDLKYEMKDGIVVANDTKVEYKGNPIGKNFSFGGNSTTIQLQDADTENLDDTYVRSDNPTGNYGTGGTLYIYYPDKLGMFKFNISSIPNGVQIDEAKLYLYTRGENFETGEAITMSTHHIYSFPTYNISGSEWDEEVVIWNTRPATSDQYNMTAEDTKVYSNNDINEWFSWSVTNMVATDYGEGDLNVSIGIITAKYSGSPSSEGGYWRSKEDATIAQRPYLNITYTEPPDETPPTYSDNSTNSTYAGEDTLFSLKWTDETELATSGGYIFSIDNGTGIFVNDSWVAFSSNPDWSNVTKTVNSTEGATIRWCVHANDTSNNWNSTSCENPFSYVTTSADTCNPTSPLTSDYVFDCNDNCTQDTTLNANGYNIIWNNAGNYYLEANIENVKNMTIANVCNFYKGNGNITMMDN